jgi:hypothetical protein
MVVIVISKKIGGVPAIYRLYIAPNPFISNTQAGRALLKSPREGGSAGPTLKARSPAVNM